MAPEHDEVRARQIAALERYVAELGVQQERGAVEVAKPRPAPERRRRPPLRWLALTALLVTLGVAGGVAVGAFVWSGDRPAGAQTQANAAATQSPNTTAAPTATTASQGPNAAGAAPVASPACKTAVDRSNAMLAIVVQLQRAQAELSEVLTDPSNRRRSGGEVLDRSAASLRAGTSESARLSKAMADYRRIVDQCELRRP
jgi:hypothetical protein